MTIQKYPIGSGDTTRIPAPEGGSATIITQDEGVQLSAAVTTLNFTGAGVTASGAGTTTTINVPGGGGAGFDWGKYFAGRFGFPNG